MTLKEYLDSENKTRGQFAKQLDVTPEAVGMWLSGQRRPREKLLRRISEVTDGKVQPNDFYAAA